MEFFMCEWCDAGPFYHKRSLSTHVVTCIGKLRPSTQQLQVPVSPSTTTEFIEPTNEPLHPSQTPQPNLASGPSVAHRRNEPLDINFSEPIDDDLEIEEFDFLDQSEPSSHVYDSTFSLINWIRTCKKGGGLSNSDIDKLFKQVLFHPSFKLEEVSVRSPYDVENYEKTLYNEADGWKKEEIEGSILNYRDPIIALESLFSSPVVAENFTLQPSITPVQDAERIYSTPATGNWWRLMQVSSKNYKVIENVFFKIHTFYV